MSVIKSKKDLRVQSGHSGVGGMEMKLHVSRRHQISTGMLQGDWQTPTLSPGAQAVSGVWVLLGSAGCLHCQRCWGGQVGAQDMGCMERYKISSGSMGSLWDTGWPGDTQMSGPACSPGHARALEVRAWSGAQAGLWYQLV